MDDQKDLSVFADRVVSLPRQLKSTLAHHEHHDFHKDHLYGDSEHFYLRKSQRFLQDFQDHSHRQDTKNLYRKENSSQLFPPLNRNNRLIMYDNSYPILNRERMMEDTLLLFYTKSLTKTNSDNQIFTFNGHFERMTQYARKQN